MKELINKIKQLRLEERKQLKKLNNQRISLENKMDLENKRNWELYTKTLFEKVLHEDDLFILKITYDVKHGLNIVFDNKTDKYPVYNIFNSYSWFNEWVKKIHNSIEIADFEILNGRLRDDYSNLENVIKSFHEDFSDEYILKRYKSLFDLLSSQVKIILGR